MVVGSSRGGAVAMSLDSGDTPLVLLCPAWKKYRAAKTVKPSTVILHKSGRRCCAVCRQRGTAQEQPVARLGADRDWHGSPHDRPGATAEVSGRKGRTGADSRRRKGHPAPLSHRSEGSWRSLARLLPDCREKRRTGGENLEIDGLLLGLAGGSPNPKTTRAATSCGSWTY